MFLLLAIAAYLLFGFGQALHYKRWSARRLKSPSWPAATMAAITLFWPTITLVAAGLIFAEWLDCRM